MRINKNLLTLALILCFPLTGCLKAPPCLNMQFDHLTRTDRIIITDNMGKEIRVITNRAKIKEITTFALTHHSGWETPWSGTPIALLRANFYCKRFFVGDLGVGDNFLTSQGCGRFQSRSVSEKDREIIMGLFSVDDPYAD
ncbi:MAG: hypothetical protein WA081_11150 [Desulfosalsimonadaceae bacterium]